MSYSFFAEYYDRLQSDIDYVKIRDILLRLFEKYDRVPKLVLDVACGTGKLSCLLAEKGIEVIGADPSYEMLSAARERALNMGIDLLLLCQSAEELDLYGTVDGAVCCLDSINHITDQKELARSFKKISLFLEPERLFIFDVNSEYKHKDILSGNTFFIEKEGVCCVWNNSECDENGVVDISLDFFGQTEDGLYRRTSEDFSERAYGTDVLIKMLKSAGLETVAVLDAETLLPPRDNSERLIFVTKKEKE